MDVGEGVVVGEGVEVGAVHIVQVGIGTASVEDMVMGVFVVSASVDRVGVLCEHEDARTAIMKAINPYLFILFLLL